MNLYLCTVNFKVGVVIDLKATVSRFLFIVHDGLNFAVLGGVGVVFCFSLLFWGLCFALGLLWVSCWSGVPVFVSGHHVHDIFGSFSKFTGLIF